MSILCDGCVEMVRREWSGGDGHAGMVRQEWSGGDKSPRSEVESVLKRAVGGDLYICLYRPADRTYAVDESIPQI